MKKGPQPLRDVALLLGLTGGPGRDALHGFSTAVRRSRLPWRLHVVGTWATAELRRLLGRGMDGAVAIDVPEAEPLRDFPGPLVFLGAGAPWLEGRKAPLAFVGFDEEAVGRAGADFLSSLGRFRSFGFAKTGGNAYSALRAAGFRARLGRRGDGTEVREWSPPPGADAEAEDASLAGWLRAMPRPAAVMAACDDLAARVLAAAARLGLRVPRDVALLGVDDDELLCETADPEIASVALDHEKMGALAAEALRRLLARPGRPPFALVAPARGVVERPSARPVPPAAALAERAAAFIRRNAAKGIGAADVAAHLGVSRSLCDLRFRQVHGESVLSAIQRVRLETARRKLEETDLPIGQVAASCGFGGLSQAGRLFRRRYGATMRQWRDGHGA